MIARSLLLKVMLSALALAAACGVAALFLGDSAEAGRLAGSAIVIVLACAALLKVGEADAGRGASPLHVVFISYVGLSVLLALFLIWAGNSTSPRFTRFAMGWYGMGIASLAVAWVPLTRRTRRMDDSMRIAERIALWGAAVTFVIGNANRLSPSLFAPGNSIASTLANEFAEASPEKHIPALFALGLILFLITFIVLGLAKWLTRPDKSHG